jgi:hypothetical protein
MEHIHNLAAKLIVYGEENLNVARKKLSKQEGEYKKPGKKNGPEVSGEQRMDAMSKLRFDYICTAATEGEKCISKHKK